MPKLILVSFREKMKTPLFSLKKGNYLDPRDVIAARAKNMRFGKGELIGTKRSVPFSTIGTEHGHQLEKDDLDT